MREEGAFHGHTPPRLCVCGIPAGGCGNVLSGPALIPQALSGFVEVYI